MVGMRAEAQVGWEGGVLVSRMLEFGLISVGIVVGNLGKMELGCCFGNGGVGGWFQGDFGREMEGCDAGSLVEIGG